MTGYLEGKFLINSQKATLDLTTGKVKAGDDGGLVVLGTVHVLKFDWVKHANRGTEVGTLREGECQSKTVRFNLA